MKQKINLSTLWLCKCRIKHKPTYHWLSKPPDTNKLQTSAVTQDNLVKHVAAQNCHWRKYRQQCSEFHTVLAWRSYEHHRQQHTEIFIISEVSETESHPSTLTATRKLPANSRKRKKSLRHDWEQQHILLVITTGVSFPYACNELEDKKFGPHWNFASLSSILWHGKHVINFTSLINEGLEQTGIKYFMNTF